MVGSTIPTDPLAKRPGATDFAAHQAGQIAGDVGYGSLLRQQSTEFLIQPHERRARNMLESRFLRSYGGVSPLGSEQRRFEKMSGPNQNKPGGKKHGKRSRKPEQVQNRKPEPLENQKAEQLLSQKPEQLESHETEQLQNHESEQLLSQEPEQLQSYEPEQLQSHEPEPLVSLQPEQVVSQQPELKQDSKQQVDAAVALANTLSVDFQTLATAYGNYTKKSFEETKAFVEKLSGVRSLDKAVEIQTEFAKQAYETFVTESQKIRELYSGLAKQSLKPFEGLVAKKSQPTR